MKFVLDTTVVSAIMTADDRVLTRLEGTARGRVAVPEPVFSEIAYGIERVPSSKRKAGLRVQLALVRKTVTAARWTDEVSDVFGVIKARLEREGHRLEDFDAAIAAHAVASGAILVSANVKHMSRIAGLTVVDWSAPE